MALPSPAVAAVAASPTWGLWARPEDRSGQVALALAVFLAVVASVPRGPRWLAGSLEFSAVGDLRHTRRFLVVTGFAAAFLSLAYIEFYLRGGPRAPQAPTFWLEGHALAHGFFTWPAPDPSGSFRAAPLLYSLAGRIAGPAPPGYPLLLAPAFLVGAPMLLGPLLAAAIVVATWLLAREMVLATPGSSAQPEVAGRLAAGLSVVCVALRYATADTVPDGLVALSLTTSLIASLRATRTGEPRAFLGAGAAIGIALMTAPGSSVAAATGVAFFVLGAGPTRRGRNLAWTAAGVLPGALVLLAANHAATGRAFTSPASAYRAIVAVHTTVADKKAAAIEALRALRAHLGAIANVEPLALVALLPIFGRGRHRGARVAGVVILVQAVVDLAWTSRAPAPAMDRSTLAAILPVEHALIAVAVAATFVHRTPAAAIGTLALSLAGFAVHTSHAQVARAKAGEGRPSFEPDVAREGNVTNGLLFFDQDGGYELASDPGATASHGVVAARLRGDDHDRLLYDLLGHPPAHRYLDSGAAPSVAVWTPPNPNGDAWRFEAEVEWPPPLVTAGLVDVVNGAGMCSSDARTLALEPTGPGEASATFELPVPRGATPGRARSWRITPRVFVRGGPGEGTLTLVERPGGPALAHWSWRDAANGPACVEIGEHTATLSPEGGKKWLVMTARGGSVALDKTVLRPR